MATNEYGLDDRYFKEKLDQLSRDARNYTPMEMHRALLRLAAVAVPYPTPTTEKE